MTGKALPPPPPSFLNAALTQTPVTVPDDTPYSPDSPAYHGFSNHPSSSVTHLPIIFPKNCPPDLSIIPNNEHPLKAHDAQYYPSEVAHKVPNSYKQVPRDKFHIENERFTGREGKDGILRRLKGIEQSLKNKQGREDQGSMTYKELSVSPDVRLPAGYKVPKFNLYDGCGDSVAHLRVYCGEMRSVGEKDNLLMAYFSKSPTGAALDWYIRQDVGKWLTLVTWLKILFDTFSTDQALPQTALPYLEWKRSRRKALESLGSDGGNMLLESIPRLVKKKWLSFSYETNGPPTSVI